MAKLEEVYFPMKVLSVVAIVMLRGVLLSAEPKPITICVLMSELESLNGQTISVRGFLEDTDEGSWLTGDCPEHRTCSGLVWRSALWLSYPYTSRKLDRFGVRVAVAEHGRKNLRIRVTLKGILQTRVPLCSYVSLHENGDGRFEGFGHLGTAVGQLNVLSGDDIAVAP